MKSKKNIKSTKKSRKPIWILAFSFIGAIFFFIPTFLISIPTIYLNNEEIPYSLASGYPIQNEDGVLQTPLRLTMEEFGCEIVWNEEVQSTMLIKDNTSIEVPIDEKHIIVNGESRPIPIASTIKMGRTYLPIRPILEAFNAALDWDKEKNSVSITSEPSIPDPSTIPTTEIMVHFIDVGQADSILIDNGTFEVLIDGGNNGSGDDIVDYIADYIDGPLDILIGTHPDADHIGGLDDVLKAYEVATIIDSGEKKETATYKDYWEAIENENADLIYDKNMTFDLGNDASLVLIETGDGYHDSNDNSVVAKLIHKEVSLLLTADMEKEAEQNSLSLFNDITVLKSGHHGSKTSSSQEFLDIVNPEYIIISAGIDNRYDHPHQLVLERYFETDAIVYGTFRSGTIVMTSNGTNVTFNTNDPVIIDDAGDYDLVA